MTSSDSNASNDNTTKSLIADLQGKRIVLHGAGAAGTYALRYLHDLGLDMLVVCFVDNDPSKHDTVVAGVPVMSVEEVRAVCGDEAIWIACALSRPAAPEIRAEHRRMGVPTWPLWKVIPVQHGLPTSQVMVAINSLIEHDDDSFEEFHNQLQFRSNPDYDAQRPPTPASETYFPDFISRRADEIFVDCGSASGDTIQQFCARWPKFSRIIAIEPDRQNFAALLTTVAATPALAGDKFIGLNIAAGDRDGVLSFQANGDYSSHVTGNAYAMGAIGNQTVRAMRLDDCVTAPTYIKADVEAEELALLWGARKLIAEQHMPVLAICAYHTSEHLWQVPLLVMSINSDYVCYLRRYGEGATELVWYFVPPDRVIRAGTLPEPPPFPAPHETYSDPHEG